MGEGGKVLFWRLKNVSSVEGLMGVPRLSHVNGLFQPWRVRVA